MLRCLQLSPGMSGSRFIQHRRQLLWSTPEYHFTTTLRTFLTVKSSHLSSHTFDLYLYSCQPSLNARLTLMSTPVLRYLELFPDSLSKVIPADSSLLKPDNNPVSSRFLPSARFVVLARDANRLTSPVALTHKQTPIKLRLQSTRHGKLVPKSTSPCNVCLKWAQVSVSKLQIYRSF